MFLPLLGQILTNLRRDASFNLDVDERVSFTNPSEKLEANGLGFLD
jgi:hypothetical protein